MKKIALLLVLAPLMSFAQDMSESSQYDNQELSQQEQPEAYRCARNSDMYCYNKPAGSICIVDPQPPYGRSGLCRTRGKADSNGDVTCVCR